MKNIMYQYKYPHPAVTADAVVLADEGNDVYVLLIKRAKDPYKGCMAFPGGFMNIDETIEDCAVRELKEETGLDIDDMQLCGVFSKVDRDPRERVISVAFWKVFDSRLPVMGDDDAALATWVNLNALPDMAFDHKDILNKVLEIWEQKR